MDRQAINARIDPWQTWWMGAPMMESWSVIAWSLFKPWDPIADWGTAEVRWVVPGDGNLLYPAKAEEELITSIRAENLREGMEDYEYLWLLRHVSVNMRLQAKSLTPKQAELLEKIEFVLWDARCWIENNSNRGKDTRYILPCWNLKNPEKASVEFDELRTKMGNVLEQAYKEGWIKHEDIDNGHLKPKQWIEGKIY
jgi:hypothetical protein